MIPSFASALRVPGYRWMLGASLVRTSAWAIETLTQGWLILQLTDSAFWLGVTVGVSGTIEFLLSVPAGAVADRVSRRTLLIVTTTVPSLVTLALALFVLSGTATMWHVVAAVVLTSGAGVLFRPARMALTADVVGPEALLNANGFDFIAWSSASMLGAVAGGLLVDGLGTGAGYLVASGGYLGAALVLLPLRTRSSAIRRAEPPFETVRIGLRYAWHTRHVRQLLLLSVVTEGFATPALYLLPVIARDILRVGAAELGYLTAMGDAGGLAAGALVIVVGRVKHREWLLIGGALGFSLGIVLLGLSRWFPVSLALMATIYVFGSVYDATMMTILQSTVPTEMRGRVLGLYSATWGTNKVGGFGAGSVAALLGVPLAIILGGAISAANALRLVPAAKTFGHEQAGALTEAARAE